MDREVFWKHSAGILIEAAKSHLEEEGKEPTSEAILDRLDDQSQASFDWSEDVRISVVHMARWLLRNIVRPGCPPDVTD